RLLELPLERAALPPPHPHEAEAAAGGPSRADDAGIRVLPVLGEALDEAGVGGGADVVRGVGAGALGVAEGAVEAEEVDGHGSMGLRPAGGAERLRAPGRPGERQAAAG